AGEPAAVRMPAPNRPATAASPGDPTATASLASMSASMTGAPHAARSPATVDLPAAAFPVSATLKKGALSFIFAWHGVAMAAPGLVRLAPADHDGRRFVGRRLAVDESLVARGGAAAHDADRVELVHDLRRRHQLRHRAEAFAAEVAVRAREDDAHAAPGERVRHADDAGVEELRFVHRDDLGVGPDLLRDLERGLHRLRLDDGAVVARDGEDAAVPVVEMRLGDLHAFARD